MKRFRQAMKINGQPFIALPQTYRLKSQAQKKAKERRKKGFKSRVIAVGANYKVYAGTKIKKRGKKRK